MKALVVVSAGLFLILWSADDARSQSTSSFKGRIPTEASPIRGEANLARMRREGCLADSFKRGACRYDLAGDPAAAYYVPSCGKQR